MNCKISGIDTVSYRDLDELLSDPEDGGFCRFVGGLVEGRGRS
jgi:hypothetical protein